VVPAILRWRDALVVTSVKSDVVAATRPWREQLGDVVVLEPGVEGGETWDPLEGVDTFRHALRVARDLTVVATTGESEFWNTLATKLVASVMVLAKARGATIVDVARALERRDLESYTIGAGPTDAREVVQHFLAHDPKTLDGVLTTAETMLLPWRLAQPLARVRPVVSGASTLYLVAPRHEQRHYEGLFRGALRAVLDEQQRHAEAGTSRRLLMVLDEAATVGSLDELDQLAATVAGLNVTLMTIVQDFAQLVARWGPRAATIVNNHTTRVVVAGLADPTLATYLPELTEADEKKPVTPTRLRRRGTAQVVSGHQPVFVVRLVPWWRDRRLRRRGVGTLS